MKISACLVLLAVSVHLEAASTYETVWEFTTVPGGYDPMSTLTADSTGALYGVTPAGGADNYGTVFKLTQPAPNVWSNEILYSFSFTDGAAPIQGVVLDGASTLYGTTESGGQTNYGTVFQLKAPTIPGGKWTETILHNFDGPSGSQPMAKLLRVGGVLYGSTYAGGPNGYGVIFQLTPPAAGDTAWNYQILYSFTNGSDGSAPSFPLTPGSDGALYGVSQGNANFAAYAYRLNPPAVAGGQWSFQVLYSFPAIANSYFNSPTTGVVFDAKGALYGAITYQPFGQNYSAFVYKLSPPVLPATQWTETTLFTFKGTSVMSAGNLLVGPNGGIYGVTPNGGSGYGTCPAGCGTVFELVPPTAAGGAWQGLSLHNFQGGADGQSPRGGLTVGKDGKVIYGTTQGTAVGGTVFQISQ